MADVISIYILSGPHVSQFHTIAIMFSTQYLLRRVYVLLTKIEMGIILSRIYFITTSHVYHVHVEPPNPAIRFLEKNNKTKKE